MPSGCRQLHGKVSKVHLRDYLTYSQEHLERIINEPLSASKSTNHYDSDSKAIEQPFEANILVYTADCLESTFSWLTVAVQFRDHDI